MQMNMEFASSNVKKVVTWKEMALAVLSVVNKLAQICQVNSPSKILLFA